MISLWKDTLTFVDGGVSAVIHRAVLGVASEFQAHEIRPSVVYVPDSRGDVLPDLGVVATEPQVVPCRNMLSIHPLKFNVGIFDQVFGLLNGCSKCVLPTGSTIGDLNLPLVVDMSGDTEVAGKLDYGNILNGGVQIVGRPISIDIGEPV